MLQVGLTGGIGSGKSTVAGMLAEAGAVVIDADAVAREVVEPGEPSLEDIRERFGDGVIAGDGTLDRAALAAIVFADDEARRDLELITHPRIGGRIAEHRAEVEQLEAETGEPHVVVLDHPLLVETGLHEAMDVVVVVVADVETRVERLVERGLDEEDARARMRSQASDDERRAVADHVVDNGGSLSELRGQVAALARELGLEEVGEP